MTSQKTNKKNDSQFYIKFKLKKVNCYKTTVDLKVWCVKISDI